MKSYRQELWFEVPTRRAFVNITPDVEETVRASGAQEGLVLEDGPLGGEYLRLGGAEPLGGLRGGHLQRLDGGGARLDQAGLLSGDLIVRAEAVSRIGEVSSQIEEADVADGDALGEAEPLVDLLVGTGCRD